MQLKKHQQFHKRNQRRFVKTTSIAFSAFVSVITPTAAFAASIMSITCTFLGQQLRIQSNAKSLTRTIMIYESKDGPPQ